MQRIGVFCGSSVGVRAIYAEAASALGGLIARRGLGLVYGGGNVGLMGVVADGALREGGEVVGVIPRALMEKELAHLGLTELHVTTSMHERKARMAELADAFVALPGGLGTLEELCEMVTWAQLGLHHKPCGLLDVEGYYGALLAMLDHAVEEGFVRREHRALLCAERDPAALLDRLAEVRPPVLEKWAERAPP